jgi:hypothetical protein
MVDPVQVLRPIGLVVPNGIGDGDVAGIRPGVPLIRCSPASCLPVGGQGIGRRGSQPIGKIGKSSSAQSVRRDADTEGQTPLRPYASTRLRFRGVIPETLGFEPLGHHSPFAAGVGELRKESRKV